MKVLVVGASGFIGRNFILKAPKNWKVFGIYNQSKNFLNFLKTYNITNVIPYKCDLQRANAVKTAFERIGNKFDICLYTAGNSDIGLSIHQPLFDLNSNVISLVNLLSIIKVKKFIYLSSGAVYLGNSGMVSERTFAIPIVPYSINKLCCESYVRYFQQHTNHIEKYVVLRFFGAYGQWELPRKIYTNMIKAFYLNNADEFTIKGNGKNYIDAMYIDDAIDGLLKVVKSNKADLVVDFCKGGRLTINELVIRVAKILGKRRIKINHTGVSSEHIAFYASSKKMKDVFNFKPEVSLEEGVVKFAKFLKG